MHIIHPHSRIHIATVVILLSRFAGTFHQNPRLFRARCAYTTDVLSVQSIAGETHCRHSFSCPRPLPTALPNRMRGNRHNGSRLSSSSVLLPESRCNNRCRRDGAMFGGGIDRKHRCRFRMYCYSNGECSVYAHRGTAPISISRLENTPFYADSYDVFLPATPPNIHFVKPMDNPADIVFTFMQG